MVCKIFNIREVVEEGLVLHGEEKVFRFPFVADLGEESGDEAFEGFFVREQGCDASATFDFTIEPFEAIGGAKFFTLSFWTEEDGEGFWGVGFDPSSKLGG